MLFNSLDFAIFLPIVFALYWLVPNRHLKIQNALIVLASYVFYACWDWRFLSLILLSTGVDYWVGLQLEKTQKTKVRKWLLWTSIAVNLGILGFFKYFNFFVDNFNTAFSFFGAPLQLGTLEIILPVGISFYTFQTLSYTIDIYRKKLEPTRDFITFAAFVSFFPQLVAGPIERASHLLRQFFKKRTFAYEKAADGMRQILWGLFKKMVIADQLAQYVNVIFSDPSQYTGSMLVIAAVLFALQIYCDFSGYSDIAIGTARLFGFDLKQNFAFPYFSRNIGEFWRRWHISLSTWFRDYLYIPLGGSRGGKWLSIRNVFIIFLVSGFWHGANWTFIAWGGLNALYFLPLLLTNNNRNYLDTVATGKYFPSLKEFTNIALTFALTVFAWIFFRAENMTHALEYIGGIFEQSLFMLPQYKGFKTPFLTLGTIFLLILIEWLGRENKHALEKLLLTRARFVRWAFYLFLLFLVRFFAHTKAMDFIYFQF